MNPAEAGAGGNGQAEREGPLQVWRLRKVGRGRRGPRGACGTLSGPGSPGSTRSTLGASLLACRGAGSLSVLGRSGEGRRCFPPLGAECRVLPCAAVLYFMFGRSLFLLLLREKQKQLDENQIGV